MLEAIAEALREEGINSEALAAGDERLPFPRRGRPMIMCHSGQEQFLVWVYEGMLVAQHLLPVEPAKRTASFPELTKVNTKFSIGVILAKPDSIEQVARWIKTVQIPKDDG